MVIQIRYLDPPVPVEQFVKQRPLYALKGCMFWNEKGDRFVIGDVTVLAGDSGKRLFKYNVAAYAELYPIIRKIDEDYLAGTFRLT